MQSLRACAVCLWVAVALPLAASPGPGIAKDRPGTPTDVGVQADGPTAVIVSFTSTAAQSERLRFEVEQMVNGKRISPEAEKALSARFGGKIGPGRVSARVPGLAANTQYCFRVWSRTNPTVRFILDNTNVRSQQPSAWACEVTRLNVPLAPLDVTVHIVSHVADRAPRVSWRTPDQSDWRGIDQYVIERKESAAPDQPWLTDRTIAGPAGAQTVSTKLDYTEAVTPPPKDGRYAYRVCSQNSGGRTCSKPVEIAVTVNPAIAGTAGGAAKAAAIEPQGSRHSRTAVEANSLGTKVGRAASAAGQPPSAPAAVASPRKQSTASSVVARPSPDASVSRNPQPLPKWTTPAATVAPPAVPAAPSFTRSALQSRTQPAAGGSPSQAPASSLGR